MLDERGREPDYLLIFELPRRREARRLVAEVGARARRDAEAGDERRPGRANARDVATDQVAFIASMRILATSGRENSGGGSSPFWSISRTFVPERFTCVSGPPGAVLPVAIAPTVFE